MIQLIPALKGLARGDENGGVDLITLENFPTEAVFAGTDYVFRHAGAILRHGYASAALTKGDQGGGRTGGDGGGGGSGKARRNVVRENVRRALVLFDMARLMRSGRYKRAVILGASWRYAAAARLAGIEDVAGYGSRLQTLFLNDGLIPDGRSIRHLHAQRLGCAAILLDRLGLALEGAPELVLPPEAAALAAAPYAHLPRPWTAVAVGSADPNRVWPADRMAAVLDRLHGAGRTTQFIVATQAEAPLVQGVIRACRTARPLPLIGQPLREVMGLLAACDMAFCTDSGIMNVAASLGVPTHALFGTVQPYAYWSCLHPIVSRAGVRPDVGVSVIDLDEVLGHFVTQGILPG
ncbi:glycosyltransferase family 9 protein [Nitrospirillum iridis]|uniref:ADP-heptose:LPS heptosyltransferase n=1 Tax=Nitrospirillum iridis TaxID=765888 RepID=A0A7X0EEH9_9PROT|nr:glycosyltransferase family 9 protein [Nitrospirillum iridis]MBB6253888.1 ADP-heptose:LPS heptosyltransferase [Nitrospirillum iridis]